MSNDTMDQMEVLHDFADLNASDKQTVCSALERGASRREVMGWLMAAGATIASAGSIVAGAKQAIAATPKKWRHSPLGG